MWTTAYQDATCRVLTSDELRGECRVFVSYPTDAPNASWQEVYNGSVKGLKPLAVAYEKLTT